MNRLKGAFDEQFEELKRSEPKVKQNVFHVVMEKDRKPKKIGPRWLAVAVAVFAVIIVGVLSMQAINQKQQGTIIDEKYFEMVLYENYELSSYFYNEPNVKALTYNKYISDLAAIDYVENERGLTIYEDRLNRLANENKALVNDILAEQPKSWMHTHLKKIKDTFGYDLDTYLTYQKEIQYKSNVAREMIAGLLHEQLETEGSYDEIDTFILPTFEAKYADQLKRLRDQYHIEPNYEYDPKGQLSTLTIGDVTYETVVVEGNHVLKDLYGDVSNIMFQIEAVRLEIERSEGVFLLCLATMDDYERAAERFIEMNHMVEEAEVFLQAIELLRNTAEYKG